MFIHFWTSSINVIVGVCGLVDFLWTLISSRRREKLSFFLSRRGAIITSSHPVPSVYSSQAVNVRGVTDIFWAPIQYIFAMKTLFRWSGVTPSIKPSLVSFRVSSLRIEVITDQFFFEQRFLIDIKFNSVFDWNLLAWISYTEDGRRNRFLFLPAALVRSENDGWGENLYSARRY